MRILGISFLLVVICGSLLAQSTSVVADDVPYNGSMYYFHQRKVARASNGTLMVAWSTGTGSGAQVQYSIYDPGFGIWSPAAALSNAGYNAIQPALASDESGSIHAIWQQRETSSGKYQVFYSRYSTGAWTTPVQISIAASTRGEEGTIEVGSDGTLWVVYNNDGEGVGIEYLYVVKSTDGGSTWSTATETISTGGTFGSSIEVGRSQIAAAPDGKIVVIWDNSIAGTDTRREVFINTWSGTAWSGATMISDTTTADRDHNRYVAVTVDASSNIYAFYTLPIVSGADPRLSHLVMHKNTWGAAWNSSYTVAIDSNEANYLSVSAVADSDGVLHLAYRRDMATDTTGLDEIVYRYSVDGGATWSEAVQVSRPNYDGGYVSLSNRVRKAYGIDLAWRESADSLVADQSTVAVLYGNLPYRTTGVETGEPPVRYDLYVNYPNPFNPSTTITFSLQTRQEVRLAVYDATGRLVRTLVHGEMEAGQQNVTWNGSSDAGVPMASGIYFSRLITSDGTSTLKMLLLK